MAFLYSPFLCALILCWSQLICADVSTMAMSGSTEMRDRSLQAFEKRSMNRHFGSSSSSNPHSNTPYGAAADVKMPPLPPGYRPPKEISRQRRESQEKYTNRKMKDENPQQPRQPSTGNLVVAGAASAATLTLLNRLARKPEDDHRRRSFAEDDMLLGKRGRDGGMVPAYSPSSSSSHSSTPHSSVPGLKMNPLPAGYRHPDELYPQEGRSLKGSPGGGSKGGSSKGSSSKGKKKPSSGSSSKGHGSNSHKNCKKDKCDVDDWWWFQQGYVAGSVDSSSASRGRGSGGGIGHAAVAGAAAAATGAHLMGGGRKRQRRSLDKYPDLGQDELANVGHRVVEATRRVTEHEAHFRAGLGSFLPVLVLIAFAVCFVFMFSRLTARRRSKSQVVIFASPGPTHEVAIRST